MPQVVRELPVVLSFIRVHYLALLVAILLVVIEVPYELSAISLNKLPEYQPAARANLSAEEPVHLNTLKIFGHDELVHFHHNNTLFGHLLELDEVVVLEVSC